MDSPPTLHRNFCRLKIFQKHGFWCRINLCNLYFHISSMHPAIIDHVYHVTPFALPYMSRDILRNIVFCQLSTGMASPHQEQQPSYPRRVGSLSPLPQQKTKPISSVCSSQGASIICFAGELAEENGPLRFASVF